MKMKRGHRLARLFIIGYSFSLYSINVSVTTNADSGSGSLRTAIEQINSGMDSLNTIQMQIPGNTPISLSSDLPVIKKNTIIESIGKQLIDGKKEYRLFATMMADLTINNCALENGAAIGGNGGGGGMGAGGGVYIDRGHRLTLKNSSICASKAQGGNSDAIDYLHFGGGGASFSSGNKHGTKNQGGGDFPGLTNSSGGAFDGSSFLTGYGGGNSKPGIGGGNGAARGIKGGYCGGGSREFNKTSGGGGGNGGADGVLEGGGGGFGSGGAPLWGGGGFGGGGAGIYGAGGFGGGGGDQARGGIFGGHNRGGGGGIGGAIFVGDSAECLIEDNVKISQNSAIGGQGMNPGEGYASDVFLFRKAKIIFNNELPLQSYFAIQSDITAPQDHIDGGLIKRGVGKLILSNDKNNYQGGVQLQEGILSIPNARSLGSKTAPLTLDGGTLEATADLVIPNPIVSKSKSSIDTPKGILLTTTGNISNNGTIEKIGEGTWKQIGWSSHYGQVNINEGILEIIGTLPSNITINPRGALVSNGTIGGHVTNKGILHPTSSAFTTLRIGGNYHQLPEATLLLRLCPQKNQSAQLCVTGGVQLDGTLYIDLQPGIYLRNNPYILIKGAVIKGDFNKVYSNARRVIERGHDFENYTLTFLEPELILPLPHKDLPTNSQNISKYLFCSNFPFDNDYLVHLLENLFQLSIPEYTKALASLTPEHYGAFPVGESRIIEYLLTQNVPAFMIKNVLASHSIRLLPLYFRSSHETEKNYLPTYQQNMNGLRMEYFFRHPTHFQTQLSGSYLETYTKWSAHRGVGTSHAAYLDANFLYSHENNFSYLLGILGGYSHVLTSHNIFIGYPIKARAKPRLWDVAITFSTQYRKKYHSTIFTPRITLLQTNIFLSSITENKPKALNLKTQSKYFGFLDLIMSMKTEIEMNCLQPYFDIGMHIIKRISDRNFYSVFKNYTSCASRFITQTYSGPANKFFIEWGTTITYYPEFELFMKYRTEFTKGYLIQGASLGVQCNF